MKGEIAGTSTIVSKPTESRQDAFALTADAEERSALGELRVGSVVGRYVVLGRIGQGGMGVVYSAYDPELDRKIALKLLTRSADERAQGRLLREAQAVARLQHQNIITVHDVGTVGDRVYMAMEFIIGQTLAAWLKEQPRRWREVIAVFTQAGEGLAAVHAAGLVHRDFKPENAMIDAKGRVRLMDFGLARIEAKQTNPSNQPNKGTGSQNLWMTQSGAIVGTPAYMAPEQWEGKETDERTDQFSFSVALWEGLYGARPFAGSNLAELAAAVFAGPPRPSRGPIPNPVARVLQRGLSLRASNRYPNMIALLLELDAASRRTRARLLSRILGGITAVSTSAAVCTVALLDDPDPGSRCHRAENQLVGVWDAERSNSVHQAMQGTNLPYANRVWITTNESLNRYADAWSSMHAETCEATHVRGEQSAELFDLRMVCLRRALTELDALVKVLAATDRNSIENAARAPELLPRLEECTYPEALRHTRRPEAGVLAAAEALRDELASVKALLRVGRYAEAYKVLSPMLTRAEALSEPSILAEVLFYHGDLAGKLGDYSTAERGLVRAFTTALVSQDDSAAARAAIESVFITGYFRRDLSEGERWAEIGDALLQRVGEDGLLRARLTNYEAILHEERGDKVGAAKLHEQSVALNRRIGAPPFTIAAGLNNLAVALGNTGRVDEAISAYEEALALYRETVGDGHPNYATTLDNLATAHSARGDLDIALDMHLDALKRREGLDPSDSNIAVTLTNVAGVYLDRGEPSLAFPYAERAATSTRASLGDRHPLTRWAATILASVYLQLGDLEKARFYIEPAIASYRAEANTNPMDLNFAILILGELNLAAGDVAAAAAQFSEALATRGLLSGATHRDLGTATFGLVRALWAMGDHRGIEEKIAEADAHFAAIRDESQRHRLAEWSREHLGSLVSTP